MIKSSPLQRRLLALEDSPPSAWSATGANARPNLHGLLRYPAMMVPRMQGDIIDAILASKPGQCRVLDPFVGSGTVMTEALVRGLDFTGVDINPLAALVCEAKAAIDAGADVEGAAQVVLSTIRRDVSESIDAEFPGRTKWFDDDSSVKFSVLRRAIMEVADAGARKVMWTVFTETVRLCSNSRTSTYKLHIRKDDDRVAAERVLDTFEHHLRQALIRVREYRDLLQKRSKNRPSVRIICEDVRKADLKWSAADHQVLVTSPPYGDNQTTIPYGQFSYLAMRWIPMEDLPSSVATKLMSNTNALDSVISVNRQALDRVRHNDTRRDLLFTLDQLEGNRDLPELLLSAGKAFIQPKRAVAFERLDPSEATHKFPELEPVYRQLDAATAHARDALPQNAEIQSRFLTGVRARIQTTLDAGGLVVEPRERDAGRSPVRNDPER